MKTITKRLVVIVLFIISGICTLPLMAQNFPPIIEDDTDTDYGDDLTKMPLLVRDRKLKEIAWKVYKHPNVKDFYREYGTPTIEEKTTIKLSAEREKEIENDPNDIWHGSKAGQIFYIVYFPYDGTKEQLEEDYAAKVYIWGETGIPFIIGLGNMFIFQVKDGVPQRTLPK